MQNQKIKYIFLVGDGMADYPLAELNNRTPLEVAETPNMDRIAACRVGCVKTIPEGMEPGSDVANLALMGYDPLKYHTGRAPFEAGSMGVELSPTEVAFRMNLVTLDFDSPGKIIMKSHSSGDITTPEAGEIVRDLRNDLKIPFIKMYPGIAYRHLLVWESGPEKAQAIPPHDVLDQDMQNYLYQPGNNPIPGMIIHSWDVLKDHPVNIARREKGLKPANSIWLWGQGKAPKLPLFKEKFGLQGGVISAVDLLKGIGFYAGFESIPVEGATGYLDTNYVGKATEAVKALEHLDFVFVHVEAPDEAGHNGNIHEKIQAIESFDEKVVGTVLQQMKQFEEYRIMVVSDHYTPIVKKTHTLEPPPFAWAMKQELESGSAGDGFTEKTANNSGLLFENALDLMPAFLGLA